MCVHNPGHIFQCPEGHLFCNSCYLKLTESGPNAPCPTCKTDLQSIRNRSLEKLRDKQLKQRRKDNGPYMSDPAVAKLKRDRVSNEAPSFEEKAKEWMLEHEDHAFCVGQWKASGEAGGTGASMLSEEEKNAQAASAFMSLMMATKCFALPDGAILASSPATDGGRNQICNMTSITSQRPSALVCGLAKYTETSPGADAPPSDADIGSGDEGKGSGRCDVQRVTRCTESAGHGQQRYLYIYMYVCVCIDVDVCMYVCMYVFVYVCVYVCMYVCMHVCMYVCMYASMYVCVCVCVCVCLYVCMHVCT